jgi:hypothetical protein
MFRFQIKYFLQRIFTVEKKTFRCVEKFTRLPEKFPYKICVLHAVLFYVFDKKIHFNIFNLQRLYRATVSYDPHWRKSWALSGWRFSGE